MIKFEKARSTILKAVECLSFEKCLLDSSCVGRVICEDIISGENIPNCDNSSKDGYAVKYWDTRRTPIKLKLTGKLKAGAKPEGKIKNGEAMEIMTGAPLPEGADAVVMVEDTNFIDSANEVEILSSVANGENVRTIGEDIKKGDLIVKNGALLPPAKLGILASIGKAEIKLVKKPKIAVITTGDELEDISIIKLPAGHVRDSNSITISASLKRDGFLETFSVKTQDNLAIIKNALKKALKNADAVIISAGASVGKYDFAGPAIELIGGKIVFKRVAMKPGRVFGFAVAENKPVFLLPGNPVTTIVTYEKFVKPALYKMAGKSLPPEIKFKAILLQNIKKQPGKKEFLRGIVAKINGKYFVKTTGEQGSGILNSLVKANCLIIAGEKITLLKKGTKVDVEIFE